MAFDQYTALAVQAAVQNGIDPNMFVRQLQQESGMNPNAVSSAGAVGIAQFMPQTAAHLGVNPNDPVASINAAARLMGQYTQQYGPVGALVAYNAGPGTVGRPLPSETQQYIENITGSSMATNGFVPQTVGPVSPGQTTNGNDLSAVPPSVIFGNYNSTSAQNPAQFQAAQQQALAIAMGEQGLTGSGQAITQRGQTIDALQNAQQDLIQQAQQAENAAQYRTSLEESQAGRQQTALISELDRNERAREANLQAAVSQWQTAMDQVSAMGQLSLAESQQVGNILQNGGDYLERAFASRGGKSPLAPVLQSDQINALSSTLNTLRGMVGDALSQGPVQAQGGTDSASGFVAGPGMGAYQAPQNLTGSLTAQPQVQIPGFPNMSQVPSLYQIPQAPAATPQQQSTADTTPNPDASQQDTAQNVNGYVPTTGANQPQAPGGYNFGEGRDVSSLYPAGQGFETANSAGSKPLPVASSAIGPAAPAATMQTLTGASPSPYANPNINPATGAPNGANYNFGPNGYANGGYTTDPQLVAGDSLDTRPNPELILNPTRAPLAIASPRFGNVPHYATGTTDAVGGGSVGGGGLAGFFAGLGQSQPTSGFGSGSTGGSSATPTFGATPTSPPSGGIAQNNAPPRPAGTPANATWNGTNYQWGGSNPNYNPTATAYNNAYLQHLGSYSAQPRYTGTPFPMYQGSPVAGASQADLINAAQQYAPPTVSALFGGQPVPPPTALPVTAQGTSAPATMPGFTSRQLSSLSPEDQQALGTFTNVAYNAPLDFVQNQAKQNYGPQSALNPMYSMWFRGFGNLG